MTSTSHNPDGRPSLYREEYCARVVELGAQGKSKAQIGAAFGVSRETLNNWANEHPLFFDALKRAQDLAMSWWEDQAQEGIWAGKNFNANAWSRSMAARFPADYRDNSRVELANADNKPFEISDTEAAAKLAKLLAVAQARKDGEDLC